ncbi:MAG: bis(5'-nucleosyl)-tetraphosphatase (symmetrical) [Nitrospira sp.]|nr:MAG: bis(5'-nucleosyl)-tetraphosphatase (symmetrical) [Nitrospira sp.]
MATYAIGDVQGCFDTLQRLVEQIQYDPASDRLWFVGDLVNRGPDSLKVLRYIKSLGASAVVVLGNHDLFLLAVAEGIATSRPEDTLQTILAAPDRDELLAWLRRQPLLYREHPFILVHAGLLPQWSIDDAEELAHEVETALRSPYYKNVLRALYPSKHLQWSSNLRGPTRLATIIKVLTRLRACSADGLMESSYSGPPDHIPAGFLPWFRIENRARRDTTIICGHWASLGLYCEENLLAIDSGCVWGRELTAIRLEDRQVFQVPCNGFGDGGDGA